MNILYSGFILTFDSSYFQSFPSSLQYSSVCFVGGTEVQIFMKILAITFFNECTFLRSNEKLRRRPGPENWCKLLYQSGYMWSLDGVADFCWINGSLDNNYLDIETSKYVKERVLVKGGGPPGGVWSSDTF